MINHVSREYALVLNLYNTAIDHQKNCASNCNVSLYQIKKAAEYIAAKAPVKERAELDSYIESMPII